MLMLTEHEEKLIQRYYIYPKIAITAVIMALALGVPFILLEMIDDLVFHDEEVIFWGLYVYLGFAALYLILFCYCTLRAKLGMRKEEWQELQRRLRVRQQQSDYSAAAAGAMAMGAAGRLMQKSQNKTVRGAGTAAQVAGAVGAVATAGAMSAEIAHNAQAMAEAYGVPLPRTKGLRTVLVLLPLVILIGTYIPQYSHAHTAMQQNTLLVSQRIEEITKALDPVCEYISADDPAERYQDYGYRVIGYLRNLRAVYNRSVKKRLIPASFPNPFTHLTVRQTVTRKRALSRETIKRICTADLSALHPKYSLARDIFMFSFFTRGMSFVDMVYLRNSDIHDGVLTYARHKTGQMLSMRIEPQLQHIIDRYSNASPYILPILAKDDSYDNYRQQQRELNKFIRKIGVLLNIPEPLTFYVARHSWATLARDCGTPLTVISAGMGHTSERTTRIYLAQLDHDVIDKANRKIINL